MLKGDTCMEASETKRLLEERLTRAEAAARENEHHYSMLVGHVAQAAWEADAKGYVVADSPSWRAYTGQTSDEWLGYGWLNAIHPDDRAFAERQWRASVEARSLVDAEFRLRSPDGGWRWTNLRAAPVFDEHGRLDKWVGMNIDIEDRKHAEIAQRESEAKFRSLFEAMDEAFAICELVRDAEGRGIDYRYVELNPALARHVGIAPESLEGRRASDVFGTVDPWLLETYIRVVDEGHSVLAEHHFAHVDRWLRINVFPRGGDRFAALYSDVTERHRAAETIRESEKRQAFLLRFTDAIRSERSEQTLIERAVRMLAEELGVDRAYATKHYPATDLTNVVFEIHSPDLSPLPATLRFSDFPEAGRQTFEQTLVFEDTANDRTLTEADKVALASMRVGALLSRPLRRDGSPIFALGVVSVVPRRWTPAEITLVEEAAERAWEAAERVRGEAALRESEERFQQFAGASASGLWIRNASTMKMEFVSPAVATIYGTAPDAFIGDIERWAAMIVPEEREAALAHLERARHGEPATHEFRIRRTDGTFRWIRNTDFPLLDDKGSVQRIGGIAEDVTEAKMAVEHQGVLLAELQHRVRNIMAMIRATAVRSADGAVNVEDYKTSLAGRILALARVQTLLTRQANAGGSLRDILRSEIGAQAHSESQYELAGPDLMLSPKAVEVLTLAFHELATNALKYGALSVSGGKVSVRWATFEKREKPWLAIDWVEEGAPSRPPPTRRGFGSELIEAKIPYELRGTGKTTIGPGGARCHIEFPLRNAESILETDAPVPTRLYGGTVDMTGGPDLSGKIILVVEDDYYMASDTAAALRGAGAEVLGPCPTEEDALRVLEEETPTAGLLDLNLGGCGPRFEVAYRLLQRGTPFIFLTGYDLDVIPDELAGIVRLQKPIALRDLVDAVSRL